MALVLGDELDPCEDRPAGESSWTLWPWIEVRISAPSSVRITPRRFGVHTPP